MLEYNTNTKFHKPMMVTQFLGSMNILVLELYSVKNMQSEDPFMIFMT